MKKFLALVAIAVCLVIIVWCCGCARPKKASVAQAAPAAEPACPRGFTRMGFQPRRKFPDGTVLPEEPMHGDSGRGVIRLVFREGVLYCSKDAR